jgi:hypothetical protein
MVETHRDSQVWTTTTQNACAAQHRLYTEKESPPFRRAGAGISHPSLQRLFNRNNPHNHQDISTQPSLKGRLSSLRATSQDLAGALLHAHLALHLLHLLLLAERQRPGDAEQQRAGADDPQGLAAEAQARGRPVVGCVGGAGELLAVGRGHDVGEGGDAVGKGLVVVVVVFDADVARVGLCGENGG